MKAKSEFKHIFLITIDCLRADFLGCIGGGTSFTPNIDKLAKDSVIFNRAFSNGPGTNQSFPAILTSTYFLMHGGMRLLPSYMTLAEVLRDNGFKTVAFHSNPFLSKSLGWNRGFNEFYDFMDVLKKPSAFVTRLQDKSFIDKFIRFAFTVLRVNRGVRMQRLFKKIYYNFSNLQIPYLEGVQLNRNVIEWARRNRDEKNFLWMHYMDPHYPYIPPEPYLSDFSSRMEAFSFNLSVNYDAPSEDEVEKFKSLYAGEVRYVDACIGEFLGFLRDESFLEDSLILIMGDHGHAFMEHNRYGHAYDILYNEVLHVPLIVYGLNDSKVVGFPVQLLDVAPTVLDVIGIEKPRSFIGNSFMPLVKDTGNLSPIFSESAKPDLINLRYDTSRKVISCIKEEWKLILNQLWETKELYNIKEDFLEKNNLVEREREIRNELESLTRKHLLYERSRRLKTKFRVTEEKRIQERLKTLRYIE